MQTNKEFHLYPNIYVPLGGHQRNYFEFIEAGSVISCEMALSWLSLDLTDNQSTLAQVMAWCRQATSHYLSQCRHRSMSAYGVTRPQWVDSFYFGRCDYVYFKHNLGIDRGWVGLWGFLWWAPSAKRKDHHGVSSGWSSVWHHSNTGLSSTQYEQIPIILGVWPFWLTPFFFRSITFWRAYG